ncbi:MAG: hypothetical protein HUK21_00490 [Fibrobacteraceae bacterium]|nr:hypothetical protein [Fibrobacteraceae bacterium]
MLLLWEISVAQEMLPRDSYENGYVQIGTDFNFGLNGGPTAGVFAVDTVERYGSNWRGLRVPLETARSYEDHIQPFFTLTFRAGYKDFHFLMEAPLRKDVEAWYDSDLKSNFTYKPSELDIAVPIKGYAQYDYGVGYVKVGRFKPELTVSPNDLTLGGTPYHDAFLWKFEPGIFRYDFMVSSLNAWLFNDVIDPETQCPPEGSEAAQQKCPERDKQASNQRDRIYDDNVKNLVYHRIGIKTSHFWAYVIEESMVGGKELEFRSLNPFMFLHNNFAGGYTKAVTTLELGLTPARYSAFYGQVNIEDINSPVGENGGASNRSMISYLVGYNQEIPTGRGTFSFRFDVVRTDPVYNNGRLPLLEYSSRRLYRSNYRDQGDPDFADMFFVDYPIGYRRGSDAMDLWLDLGWKYKQHTVVLNLAWLRQGDKELYTDYDIAIATENSTSGVEEAQYIADLQYSQRVNEWFGFYLGGGLRRYENLDHIVGEDGVDGWVNSGIKVNFNPIDSKF